METKLRILHLEDDPHDSELIQALLEGAGIGCEVVRVQTGAEFSSALVERQFDLIVSDFTLPAFDGLSALAFARERAADLPFLFVSGTIGEEIAIESLKGGATDYVLKQRLDRLVPAVRRALREAQERADRQRFEEKLREQAALLDQAHDAILVSDLEGRIKYWNAGAARLYGWSAAEVLGQEMEALLDRGERIARQSRWRQVGERGGWEGEAQQITKDGKPVTVESRWTLLRTGDGDPRSLLVINNDITERKLIEAQFLRTQRLDTIGSLASGVAHDLNNVLTPILIGIQMLRVKLPDAGVNSLLDSMELSLQRGVGMVSQIVSFARGAEGERVPIEFSRLIQEQVKIVRETFSSAIQIRTRVTPDLWMVLGNATHLQQVLLNLCVNARDAMPAGGVLTLEAENVEADTAFAQMNSGAAPGAYVVLTVADTGTGIPPQTLARIFDPFFTTKEPGKGTGIGLSTVKGIVKNHGGFISVYSEVNKGTRFKLFLPAARQARAGSLPVRPQLPHGLGECILLIDDDRIVREITQATLEAHGYRVYSAGDGVEAVVIFSQKSVEIALVISDIAMPFLDGPATIRALERIRPQVPIVAISGLVDNASAGQWTGQGQMAFLQKPFTTEALLTCIHGILHPESSRP